MLKTAWERLLTSFILVAATVLIISNATHTCSVRIPCEKRKYESQNQRAEQRCLAGSAWERGGGEGSGGGDGEGCGREAEVAAEVAAQKQEQATPRFVADFDQVGDLGVRVDRALGQVLHVRPEQRVLAHSQVRLGHAGTQ